MQNKFHPIQFSLQTKLNMKEIPSSKLQRTSRFVKTGIQIGGNYIKHYAQKLVTGEADNEVLNKENAEDIYAALSELKGSALKAAQMLSMDQGMMPSAFSTKFSEAQYKAPALSGPLVVKTFSSFLGKTPTEVFDTFDMKAIHAASMGQVHKATKDGITFAVKIQYPGVADSVISDLNMVRPVAKRLFGWKDSDIGQYFDEVKERLVEETDYVLEKNRAEMIAEKCKDIPNIHLPKYFAAYCSSRILTMEWMNGKHLEEWLATSPSQEMRNKAGQALWDFYNYQIHNLYLMHADAHPGNFLFTENGELVVLDFGCMKELPKDFYKTYFELLKPGVTENPPVFKRLCLEMEALLGDESPEEEALFLDLYKGGIELLCRPFHTATFDFSDKEYFKNLYDYGEKTANIAKDTAALRKKPRGSRHGIYLNRTYFGIFNILHSMQAKIETRHYMPDWI